MKVDQNDWEPIPVCLLTGFLGSGKTTVLNHLLRQKALSQAVVIINEFGEIGLDHELVEVATENLVLLQSGCLCCTIRGDLTKTLRALLKKRQSHKVAAFDRVIIETTGLADPAPILHTLMTDELLSSEFRLDSVIATVDAVTGNASLDSQFESVKQIAVADRLLLTKTDLAIQADIPDFEARLRALNPSAPILRVLDGAVDAERLLDAGLYNPKTKSLDVQKWLNTEAYAAVGDPHDHHGENHNHRDHKHGAHSVHHRHDVNRHDEHISSVAFTIDEPIPPEVFDVWLETLILLCGPNILRMKALVHVAGVPSPFVLHGVQHIFHPPVSLPDWPSDDRRTRIVLIGRDMTDGFLNDSFAFLQQSRRRRSKRARPRKESRAA